MRYNQDFIEKVRDANNLVEIIGQYTELKGRGDQYMGICPFPDHSEKTGSFSVSEGKQLYHCFGCGKGGNIFSFLETYNGFSFVEAIEYLAARAHIPLPDPEDSKSAKPRVSKDQKSQFFRANKFAAVFYHQKLKSLPASHKAHRYLQKRNLSTEMIEEFRIGYASENWDDLLKYFESKKIPIAVGEKLGLLRRNKKGGFFDLYRDRIMYPIFSLDGEVVGFGGRIIDQGQPKYINSHESEIFKKGNTFYGLDKAAKFIRGEDKVFIVEGYMDLLALYSRGVNNVVATLGTALTENHVKRLKRWTKNVVLVFDGDSAGQTAAERSLPHFFAHDMSPLIFVLPEGKDPDDFISEKGREAFIEQSNSSQDLFLHLLQVWMKNYKGQPKDKIEIVDKAAPLLRQLQDTRLKQIYLEELARHLGEPMQRVAGWIKTTKGTERVVQADSVPAVSSESGKMALKNVGKDELAVLGLSLKSPKFMDFFVRQEGLSALEAPEIKELFTQIVAKYRQQPENFDKLAHLVVSRVENPEKIVNVFNISSASDSDESDEKLMKECLYRVKDRFLQRQIKHLTAEVKKDPAPEKLERIMNIQKERITLKNLKISPLGES
ncbi:MAG: DNA primase [Bdellovibrionales bacterium]|nr:DNA primase [Bdellovibrionales bacterium]